MILYCILGVGMLCFNTRLGCFESNTSAEISKHVKEFFSIFQSSVMQKLDKRLICINLLVQLFVSCLVSYLHASLPDPMRLVVIRFTQLTQHDI
jgi:hypothetical protein